MRFDLLDEDGTVLMSSPHWHKVALEQRYRNMLGQTTKVRDNNASKVPA